MVYPELVIPDSVSSSIVWMRCWTADCWAVYCLLLANLYIIESLVADLKTASGLHGYPRPSLTASGPDHQCLIKWSSMTRKTYWIDWASLFISTHDDSLYSYALLLVMKILILYWSRVTTGHWPVNWKCGQNLPSAKWFWVKDGLIFHFCQFANALSSVAMRAIITAATPTEPRVCVNIMIEITWLLPTYQQQSIIRRIMNRMARPMHSHAHHWRPFVVSGPSVLTSK